MSEFSVQIDGKEILVSEGMTILAAAERADIAIPTVCHHEQLQPFGGCRLCTVEAEVGGRTNLVAACIYPVQPGLAVKTRSAQIDKIRKILTEQLLARAPESDILKDLARDYHADKDRFPREPSFCILCGLCVRYCAEIKQKNAVGFVDRGPTREISFIPEIANEACWDCKECFPLCPTSALQAAYVLMRSLAPASRQAGAQAQAPAAPNGHDQSFAPNDDNRTLLQASAER